MNEEDHKEFQRRLLADIELRINDLNAGHSISRDRPVIRAVIKDELTVIRENIFGRNKYWENAEKLKSLETAFASLED